MFVAISSGCFCPQARVHKTHKRPAPLLHRRR
jgi:hypothetical protein